MPAHIIDGAAAAAQMLEGVRAEAARLPRPARLGVIRANADPGSGWYAKAQAKHCAENGVGHVLADLGAEAGRAEILAQIARFNQDPEIDAMLLLLPLPRGVDYLEMASAIDPGKDAEGVHPANLGRLLATGRAEPAPCTALSAVTLAASVRPDMRGLKAMVLGRSAIVGKPAAILLLNHDATVTIAHSRSDVAAACRDADVLIAATGAAGAAWNRYRAAFSAWEAGRADRPAAPDLRPLVRADMVKPGAVVIDVGVNQVPRALDAEGRPVKNAKGRDDMVYAGDVDFEGVKEVAGHLTHPQGGVGPLTNAFLLRNAVRLALARAGTK